MPSAFFSSPAAGGIVLIIASAAAIIVANSPLREGYEVFLKYNAAGLSVEHWINDALMAVFFMMVGLEIKRELLTGQLATWGQRALPGFAALGGMAVPAAIYVWFNAGSDETLAGWAIPAATDIAFALGVLALLGSRVPASLKIFLSALAILDDMGAVAIIALFYTSNISFLMLAGAAVTVALLFIMNRAGITRLFPYLLAGGVLWFFMLQSGVHATIAGILLALFIPLRVTDPDKQSPLARLEHGIHTMAGDGGKMLSGGERQRISLARAILKNAPIVVLDEATAFMDPENEEKMNEAIAEVIRGKTVLVIAHRLHSIVNADQICVLEQGTVADVGTHEELLGRCPAYQKLWQAAEDSAQWGVNQRGGAAQ